MSKSLPALPARYYLRMAEVAIELGADVPAILARTGIDARQLAEPEAVLSLQQMERLVSAMLEQFDRTELALQLGQRLKASSHSILGYGLLSSPTLDYAMRLAARHFSLITPTFSMRYWRQPDKALVRFEPRLPMNHDCLNFHIELITCATHLVFIEMFGNARIPQYRILLSTVKPQNTGLYQHLARAQVHFEALPGAGAQLEFPPDLPDLRPHSADPDALALAERRCRELAQGTIAQGAVSDWVRMMLRESAHGLPTLADLAHTLNLSPRTLDRHLKREGSGFRQLIKQARTEQASQRLRSSDEPITRIALDLGYSDAANFTRAFRRETGISPSAYRASQRGE